METMARLMIILGLGCLVLMGVAGAQSRSSVNVPASVRNASHVVLELSLRSVRKPPDSNIAAVVRLKGQEVGRISLVSGGDQRFQLNVTDAVKGLDLAGKSADIEVSLVDRVSGSAPTGASVAIGSAHISSR
jgi:hypothetical protein